MSGTCLEVTDIQYEKMLLSYEPSRNFDYLKAHNIFTLQNQLLTLFFFFKHIHTRGVGEGIRTSDIHFMRHGPQSIELPFGDKPTFDSYFKEYDDWHSD